MRDRIVPRMNSETPAQLVTHLSHPNGWWRDTAQQLLVLKQDKSVVPALLPIAAKSPNLLARFHAMWTLEGLGALKPALVRAADEGPRAADAHPGDSRQRDPLQGGRPIVCRRLRGDDEGRRRRRRDPGDPDDQPVEGAGRSGDDQDGDGGQRGARRAGRGDHDAQSSGERRRTRRGAVSLPSNRASSIGADRSTTSSASRVTGPMRWAHRSRSSPPRWRRRSRDRRASTATATTSSRSC